MARNATLRKVDANVTSPAKNSPAKNKKQPQLRVVKGETTKKTTAAGKIIKSKKTVVKQDFKSGHFVVYPTHGVGQITEIVTQEIAGTQLKLLVIEFEKDRMTLSVPMARAAQSGLRHVGDAEQIKKVVATLKSKAKVARGMWSRRAQEYEAKINSGDVVLVSEVVRDLHQNVDQAERSYSERMIYEAALARLVGELAAAEKLTQKEAHDKLMKILRAKKAA